MTALCLALLLLIDPPPLITPSLTTPTPTPSTGPLVAPRLIAALDATQADAGERIALFDDNTLAHAVRYRGRITTSRKTLSTSERDVIVEVAREALGVKAEDWSGTVLVPADRRTYRLEVRDGAGVRTYVFDDLSRLPLAVGRMRGALEDLKGRFFVPSRPKEELWDPAKLGRGDLVRRRSDGRWFRIVRDDSQNTNLELLDAGNGGLRFFMPREEVPRGFEDPATQDPPRELLRP